MFDAKLRPLIDPPLNTLARRIAARGITADAITIAGFGVGMAAAAAIAFGVFTAGLVLIVANRLADGLDGAVARVSGHTDRGGFLDIVLDFVFYAAIPLAFAIFDPPRNALPAAGLLAAFYANGAAFFAYATAAQKRGLTTSAQGQKSFYYLAGLTEGAETIAVFCAMCLWPAAFPWLATAFAAACTLSAAARLLHGWRTLA
jgi:phosphatidylglycerophosphate synthase